MRTNNEQKIRELEKVLDEIIERSRTAKDYDIDTLSLECGELLVNVALVNEDGVVIWQSEGTYFEVLCAVKLILYPLL